jgi:transcriptional regulator with XRE-family HTH domain
LPITGWAKPEAAPEWQRSFGVRELRLGTGVSQMQLAHLDPTCLSAVEQGRRNISLVNIRALARALDVPASALFEEAPTRDMP